MKIDAEFGAQFDAWTICNSCLCAIDVIKRLIIIQKISCSVCVICNSVMVKFLVSV
jgi:hypothetical protein